MENHPEFARITTAQTMDELRHLATRRYKLVHAQKIWTTVDVWS